jgi:hypothetical protein
MECLLVSVRPATGGSFQLFTSLLYLDSLLERRSGQPCVHLNYLNIAY